MDKAMGEGRVRTLAQENRPSGRGPVLYWMQRDQRARDNWALLHAQAIALAAGRPLGVVFCLVPDFLTAARRQFAFMLAGLQETTADLAALGIPLVLLEGDPAREIAAFAARHDAARLVLDANPLRLPTGWQVEAVRRAAMPVDQVDAHNVVPVWVASQKQEYTAATLRPKLNRLLPRYLNEFPALVPHPHPWADAPAGLDPRAALARVRAAEHGPPLTWITPGPRAAGAALAAFVAERLDDYALGRNDPARGGQSDLSPYFHFGQLAPQRAALVVATSSAAAASREAYLEELIVRRELADNFCFYNPHYDDPECFPAWARGSLEAHAADRRETILTRDQLEAAASPDPLWNAAQRELVHRGKMHGYLRMYWAKQILTWTRDADEALAHAIALNDRYELDGRDPSGYAGCAWSIGGVHDRPWGERPVFGLVRSMTHGGCRRKFKVEDYMRQVGQLVHEARR
jgi:deoxyribodipyrimidine photo-lyase